MDITFKLETFEGPLDLLLYLIEKSKLNIYDIPIALITDQYIEYIQDRQHINLENMSEFLVMASTLLYIKSKMLLPKTKNEPEDEEDPREELVQKLLEYKKIKYVSEELKEREKEAEKMFYRTSPLILDDDEIERTETSVGEVLQGITVQQMYQIFQSLVSRKKLFGKQTKLDFKMLKKDAYTIEQKSVYILDLLELYDEISFYEMFEESIHKMEIVVTFLAVLELVRNERIQIIQQQAFDDIIIKKYTGVNNNEKDKY